ncbi:Cuticle protein 16.8 like protein [Argiope bruennichi]|uniref:Cuticle protein 16.8 like protein n=1 Tax=Argiope bruennichi TaxID=94029 RepID=A0A8T0EH14_ARGBR|nr:Cuticle protein 16.8 like protein [Argiope bruennichi]
MFFKIAVAFFFVVAVSASHYEEHEEHHDPIPYKFGYEVKDHEGSQHRHEEGDGHGNVRGSYGYVDHKGIHREVHYVADKGGFRAEVKTNEPGTANQDPAQVKIHSDASYHHHHEPHHVHDDIHDNHGHGYA